MNRPRPLFSQIRQVALKLIHLLDQLGICLPQQKQGSKCPQFGVNRAHLRGDAGAELLLHLSGFPKYQVNHMLKVAPAARHSADSGIVFDGNR